MRLLNFLSSTFYSCSMIVVSSVFSYPCLGIASPDIAIEHIVVVLLFVISEPPKPGPTVETPSPNRPQLPRL